MAAESRNISGEAGWSNGDIVQLVALLIGIPAAIVGFVVLATYYRRRRQRRRDRVLGEAAGGRDTHLFEETAHIPDPAVGVSTIAFPQRLWHSSIRRGRTTWPLTKSSRRNARGVPVEVHGGVLTPQTSASGIPLARGETELRQTGTEFLDEVHAYIDRERRDWQEELV